MNFDTFGRGLKAVLTRLLSIKEVAAEIEFVGFIICNESINQTQENISHRCDDLPIPNTLKDLQSFLGMSWYLLPTSKAYSENLHPYIGVNIEFITIR